MHTCSCGWSGSHEELESEAFSELLQLSCPKCEHHLLLVSFPVGDDIKLAAEEGNDEAKAMLARVLASEESSARWEREVLRTASQLPELDGDELVFLWELAPDDDYVIKAGEQLVWREHRG